MSNKTASLMASLTGDLGGGDATASTNNNNNAAPEQDLFGDIPIDDPPPPQAPALSQSQPSMPTNAENSNSNSESIYLDPMSGSVGAGMPPILQSMPQNNNFMPQHNVQTNMQPQMTNPNMPNNTNFPYPQPPQQQPPFVTAPNITYADTTTTNNNSMAQSQPVLPSESTSPPPPAPAPAITNTNNMAKSLLMTSGLLGMAGSSDEKKADNGGSGGGLFDDIDQQEAAAQQQAAAAAAAEQKRLEEEAAAAEQKRQEEAAAAAEQLRLQQQQQQMQQMQQPSQQYSLEARMQGMHLNNNMNNMNMNVNGQNSYLQQSQQMQPNQGQGQPQFNQQSQGQMMNQQQQQLMQPSPNPMERQIQQPPAMQQPGQLNPPNQMPSGPGMDGQNQMQPSVQQPPGSMVNPMQQQPQQNPMQQPPGQINVPGVMYRDHGGMDNSSMMNPANAMNSSSYLNRSAAAMMAPQQPQGPGAGMTMNNNMGGGGMDNSASPNRFYHPTTQPSVTAGMHNSLSPTHQPQMQQQQQPGGPYGMPQQPMMQQRVHMPAQPLQITKPPDVPTYYGKVTVNDPMLLQAPSKLLGMVSSPPHWSYQFTTQIRGQPPSVWIVRRRFKHVVALEDRLRHECPGAILPPRPDKHVSRAIEEASTHQSAEFAWQRAAELETYLNALVVHPEVFASQSLKMFLGLQDDMGTAWPEVSANAFTRMSALGASAASKVTETSTTGFFGGTATAAPGSTTPNQSGGVMSNVMGQVASSVGVGELVEAVTEDSAELLALSSSESVRMGAVLQAVPKLEGAVTLLREQGEGAGAVGMELNRLAKEVLNQGDRELAMPLEILSNGLLRYGRRTKRLGQEIGQATMSSFHMQYKMCRYEKMAWADRRNALNKRTKERAKADKRAQQLMVHQQQYPPRYGGPGGYGGGYGQPNMNQYGGNHMDQMVSNATMSDNMAVDAVRECDEVGERLKREVNRISFFRRMDWAKSVKVIASYMKEAATERVAIWESTRDTFLQTFPDYHNDTAQWTNVAPNPQLLQPQMQQQSMNMNMSNSYMGQPGMMMSQSYQQQPQQQQQYNSMMGSAMMGTASVGGGYQQR